MSAALGLKVGHVVLAASAFALFLASTLTPVLEQPTSGIKLYGFGPKYCMKGQKLADCVKLPAFACDKQKSHAQALDAFWILSDIASFAALAVGGASFVVPAISGAIAGGVSGVATFFGIILVALDVSFWNYNTCGTGSKSFKDSGLSMGDSQKLAIAGFVVSLVATILGLVAHFVAPAQAAGGASSGAAPKADPAVQAGTTLVQVQERPKEPSNPLSALNAGESQKPADAPKPKAEEKPAPKAEEKPAPKAEEKPAPKPEEKTKAAEQKPAAAPAPAPAPTAPAASAAPAPSAFPKPDAAAQERAAEEKHAKAASSLKSINFEALKAKLPATKGDAEQKQARFAMFDAMDAQKTGKLTLEQIRDGLRNVVKVGEILPFDDVVEEAFARAAEAGQLAAGGSAAAEGGNTLEKNEFRLLLLYLRQYLSLFQVFVNVSGDAKLSRDEFQQAVPRFAAVGLKLEHPEAVFAEIDGDKSGSVVFHEFARWAMKQNGMLDG